MYLHERFYSLDQLTRSSDSQIWKFSNEDWGCLSRENSTPFYRELASIFFRDPDPEKATWIRFPDYFLRKKQKEYEIDLSEYQPEMNALVDELLGKKDSAEQLSRSLDQSPMQFFIDHFVYFLSNHFGRGSIAFEKKHQIFLEKIEDKMILKIAYQITNLHFSEEIEAFPFEFEAKFEVLAQGVQLMGIAIKAKEPQLLLLEEALLGKWRQTSLMDRLQIICVEILKSKKILPKGQMCEALLSLVCLSPEAAVGLCKAISLGATNLFTLPIWCRMTQAQIHHFLRIVGTFVADGSLEALLNRGVDSWTARRRLKRRLNEIEEAFFKQIAVMEELCPPEAPLDLFKEELPRLKISQLSRAYRRHSEPLPQVDLAVSELEQKENLPKKSKLRSSSFGGLM